MIKIGLTGSIAMGKSATSNMFRAKNIPIFDADQLVHVLYQKGHKGYDIIEQLYPEALGETEVDRVVLSKAIQANPELLKAIEAEIHPLIRKVEQEFIHEHEKLGAKYIIFDVPLLFEMGTDQKMDKIIVVSTDAETQKKRALARDNMTLEKFEFILSKQIPNEEKIKRADFVIDTSISLEDAQTQVEKIIEQLDQLNVS